MRLKQVAIAFDQLIGTIVLNCMADETMSAKCWRLRDRFPYKQLRVIIDVLFFFQKQHCREAYESEIDRNQLPKEYRE